MFALEATHMIKLATSRRRFLLSTGWLAGVALSAEHVSQTRLASLPRGSYPFTLGVASGDPLEDSVVLWTRLAPDPLAPDGGMPAHPVPVRWEVSEDVHMRRVIKRGTAIARPEYAHSVHVDVRGLAADREYYYRFAAGGEESPVGRTRTAPPASSHPMEVSFAFASCQEFHSYYTAYRHMAAEDLDFVVHLGDYIYENVLRSPRGLSLPDEVILEPKDLPSYRLRHSLYRSDPNLQAAHAAFPWIVTWDDHEVENNYADEYSEDYPNVSSEEFLIRRAAAYRAYWEHMPLRVPPPNGSGLRLYRKFSFGDLLALHVLDTRQYRDRQTDCAGEELVGGYCRSAVDPNRTILGDDQRRWLLSSLEVSSAIWNVLAQQIIFSQRDNLIGPGENYVGNGDQWDGYKADRDRLLEFLRQRRPSNPIIITGDVHRNYAYNIKADFGDPDSETLGAEYVGTSISSGGTPTRRETVIGGTADDPHQVMYNNSRGYVRCRINRDTWQTDYRVVDTVSRPESPISTLITLTSDNGEPGIKL